MGNGKMDLVEAREVADRLVDHLGPAFDKLVVAGSIRRGKLVVGDVELVGICNDQDSFLGRLKHFGHTIKPGTPDVVPWTPKPDAKYVRARLDVGINLDVFIGDVDNFGGLLLMRTGSGVGPDGNAFSGFTPGIFSRWKKVSGGGRMVGARPTTVDGFSHSVPTEEAFFDLLGMHFVPPEERLSKAVIKHYLRS